MNKSSKFYEQNMNFSTLGRRVLMWRETKNRGGGDPRSFPSSGFAVTAFAGAAGTAVATAGVLSLLSLANQMANNEKDNSK